MTGLLIIICICTICRMWVHMKIDYIKGQLIAINALLFLGTIYDADTLSKRFKIVQLGRIITSRR